MNAKATLIMTTVDSDALAADIGRRLVEQKLAACVQEVRIQSRYRWEGEVRCDPEILLLVKTSTAAADDAMRVIRDHHSYDLPEIVALPITAGLPGYLQWLDSEAG